MRILVVSQYFPPEMGAPAGRFHDFARHWIAAGHEVTVVTGFPNFPAGVLHREYRGRLFQSETIDGVRVERGFVATRPRAAGRPAAYASFLLSAALRVALRRRAYDCVVATIPPPSAGLPGLLAARRRGVPFVVDVRDIWPEAIVQSGRLSNPVVIHAFDRIARLLYDASARITTVTHGWKSRLIELGVAPDKVDVLPNGVDIDAFDSAASQPLSDAFSSLESNAMWFTYAGIFNRPQGLDIVLQAVERLRERAPEDYAKAQFVLVGEGPIESELRAERARLALDRVVMVPRQPRPAVYGLLRRSHAILVTLRPRKDASTVPSKLYESLASGRPVIYQAGGEGADTVRESGGGVVCSPGDPDALCQSMRAQIADAEAASAMGARGREFVQERFDRRAIAARFADLLLESVREP